MTGAFRAAPFTLVFLLSEACLLAAALVGGHSPWAEVLRVLIIPAWIVIQLVSLVAGSLGHWGLVFIGLVLAALADLAIHRWK